MINLEFETLWAPLSRELESSDRPCDICLDFLYILEGKLANSQDSFNEYYNDL